MAANISAGYSDEGDDALSGINVTPLVDVTLVLLIVFMITVPAIVGTARVNVDLPETSAVKADSTELPLIFALKRNESGTVTLYLNDEAINEARVREMFTRRIPRPRVIVEPLLSKPFERERRGEMDRRHHCAMMEIGRYPCSHRAG